MKLLKRAYKETDKCYTWGINHIRKLYTDLFNSEKEKSLDLEREDIEQLNYFYNTINEGDSINNHTMNEKMEMIVTLINMSHAYAYDKISANADKFINKFNPKTLTKNIVNIVKLLEDLSTYAFIDLKEYAYRDFGEELVSNPVTTIETDKLLKAIFKYRSIMNNHINIQVDEQLAKSLFLLDKSIADQFLSIESHIFTGIHMSSNRVSKYMNKYNENIMSNNTSSLDNERLHKYMLREISHNKWNTKVIIFPIMNSSIDAIGIGSTTINYGYYDIDKIDEPSYAINMYMSSMKEVSSLFLLSNYFISNILSHLLNNKRKEVINAILALKDSYTMDLVSKKYTMNAIKAEDLLYMENCPEDVKEAIKDLISGKIKELSSDIINKIQKIISSMNDNEEDDDKTESFLFN